MRIVCLSDTHDANEKINVPDGDVVIHAGDLTFRGSQRTVTNALRWIDSLPHKHKIVVPGNHDFFFMDDDAPTTFRGWNLARTMTLAQVLETVPSVNVLIDQEIVIDGIKFYGSPWQPWYGDWAFNFPLIAGVPTQWTDLDALHDRMAAHEIWSKIPDDVNVLVTHSPPNGILDTTYPDDERQGCPVLMRRIRQLEHLRLHVFGHLHEARGIEEYEAENGDKLTFVNAAIMTREYEPTNEPIIVEI